MITRDTYIAMLEKRAMQDMNSCDGQEDATKDYAENSSDNRAYLLDLFAQSKSSGKTDTALLQKLFPGKSQKEPGHPLLKTASRSVFFRALQQTESNLVKTASPTYLEVAYRSFCTELEKISVDRNG